MLTSHAYQASHDHFNQSGLYHQDASDVSKSQVEGGTTKIMNPSPTTCGDPFGDSVQSGDGNGTGGANNSPPHHFGADEEFDSMGINIPSSALEEQQQGHQGGGSGYNNYHQHQMAHHQQHQQQWQQHHHHQMQQQQWHQQGQYMGPNGYGHGYDQYGYGDYSQMYGQGSGSGHTHGAPQGMSSNNGTVVGMGGPSPVGSHNTPSPQGAHSDDGVLGGGPGEDHIRNNNILKRPSPGSVVPGVAANSIGVVPGATNMHPGVMHHGHQGVVHPMGHHHPHHHAAMGSPYHLHGQHQIPPPGMPVAKKPKVSKRKKKRDPNEPNKPVSAYALFFRDSQASIKVANPNAAFGDVSKIVASLWDALDPDSKAAYKKRTENAKKDYLKKLASYRASLVSSGKGEGGIGYGYYGYSDVMQNNGIHPSHKYMGGNGVTSQAGGGQTSSSYMGQPIPPRPPIQHGQAGTLGNAHLHHGHGTPGAYMMQGQMQNGVLMGGQSPHSGHSHGVVPHSSMSQHSPMDNNSHNIHNQPGGTTSIGVGGGPIHSPNGGSTTSSGSSSGQTPLNTPTSASISSSSPNNCVMNKSSQQQQGGTTSAPGSSHGKQCGRPGCSNLVQRSPEGWTEEFCSNECVVGQCKEVYTSWSSGGNPVNNSGSGGPPPNPYSSPAAPPVK